MGKAPASHVLAGAFLPSACYVKVEKTITGRTLYACSKGPCFKGDAPKASMKSIFSELLLQSMCNYTLATKRPSRDACEGLSRGLAPFGYSTVVTEV